MVTAKLFKLVSLKERLELKKDISILDVGCNEGRHLHDLKVRNILRVGLDINKSQVRMGKQKYAHVHFILGDACYLPFRNNSFDILMSRQFVSHVWNLDEAIEEMRRVCLDTIYVEDSNILNPVVFFSLIAKLGINWLWKKSKFNRTSKLEDIHSIFWWKRKFKKQIILKTRKEWQNPLLNILWKHFGPDCIFHLRR